MDQLLETLRRLSAVVGEPRHTEDDAGAISHAKALARFVAVCRLLPAILRTNSPSRACEWRKMTATVVTTEQPQGSSKWVI
ncbi:MAG: hypothetical protein ACI9DC_004907 [Gammaproteobacteria bacterium]